MKLYCIVIVNLKLLHSIQPHLQNNLVNRLDALLSSSAVFRPLVNIGAVVSQISAVLLFVSGNKFNPSLRMLCMTNVQCKRIDLKV